MPTDLSDKEQDQAQGRSNSGSLAIFTAIRRAAFQENDFEIVSAYATFCEHTTTRPDCFYDASVLPHPKHAIVAAVERQIVLEPADIRAEWLQTGPMFL